MPVEPTIGELLPLSTYQTLFQLGVAVNLLLTVFEQIVSPVEAKLSQRFADIDRQTIELGTLVKSDELEFWYEKIENPRPRDEIQKDMRRGISGIAFGLHKINMESRNIRATLAKMSRYISAFAFMCLVICLSFLFVFTFYTYVENFVIISICKYFVSIHLAILSLAGFVFLPLVFSFVMAAIFKWIIFSSLLSKLDGLERHSKTLYSEICRPSSIKSGGFSSVPVPPPHIQGLMKKKPPVVSPPGSLYDEYVSRELSRQGFWRSLRKWLRRSG